ncbi:MAG: biotin--[acetyl-CoA-carboxylase] ligase [Kiritimatiellales bacterium]
MMKFKIQWFDRLPSTNTFLKESVEINGVPGNGTIIAAREQTQGRGRQARQWISGANENLTFSVFISDRIDPQKLPSSTMAAAIAIRRLLAEEKIPAILKWPNDVLVNGKKICGILSERISAGLIIGIGLNVNMRDPAGIDQPATSIFHETGERQNLEELLDRLLAHLAPQLTLWKAQGFAGLRAEWEAGCPALGSTVTVRDGDSKRTGILAGFGSAGELLLRDSTGGNLTVWAGDLDI